MFSLFGKKSKGEVILYAPVKGKVIDIENVHDEVFSQKIAGDGVAVEPTGSDIVAPCDGEIMLVAQTKHAVALQTKEGLEVLIHVGLDTALLEGEGFSAYVKTGDSVRKGDKLLSFDRELLESRGISSVTPLVITNMADKVKSIEKNFPADNGQVMRVILK